MGKLVNQKELIEILGCSERHLLNLRQREGLPVVRKERGKAVIYDTAQVIEFLNERAARKAAATTTGTGGGQLKLPYQQSLTEQQTRAASARADRLEMENEVRRGELVPFGELELTLPTIAIETRERLQGISIKLAPELVGLTRIREIKVKIDEHVERALAETSRSGEQVLSRIGAASARARRRVGGS